jgi:hypothetical protein
VVCVFARKTPEPSASLVKQIDKKIGENKSLKSFVVIMTKDGEGTRGALKKLAKAAGVKSVPLTMNRREGRTSRLRNLHGFGNQGPDVEAAQGQGQSRLQGRVDGQGR